MKLRIAHKLALSLSLAALLPVVVAATVAVQIVLGGLEDGLDEQTLRQLRVGLSLVLRTVERLGGDAQRLASHPRLAAAIAEGERPVQNVLAREDPHLPSSLVQIADQNGRLVAARAIGGDILRFRGMGVEPSSPVLAWGLGYERRVTLVASNGLLVVRAVAPVVDESYVLKGVVVVTLPLDADFADSIKGALDTDVVFHAGSEPATSSFQRDDGARVANLMPPPGVADDVLAGGMRLARATIDGHEYSVGYAPLKDLGGARVGMFGVAVGRGALARAKSASARSLALGALGAIAFALGVAGLLSRRLSRPIARLHSGVLAVSRGELDTRLMQVDTSASDEIGDLAVAFQTMTTSLRVNQERLAARMREIVALHEAGRAVSSVLGLDEVLHTIVDSVARVLDARLAALWLVEGADPGEPSRPRLGIGAARTKPMLTSVDRRRHTIIGEDALSLAQGLAGVAADVAHMRLPIRVADVTLDPKLEAPARAAHVDGSLLVVPLERGRAVVGVLVVGRDRAAAAFTDADENLLATFADQAATAIENARLYTEVRAFSEELEEKVKLRTRELTTMNLELGRALAELKDTQAQLILSERLAGLGTLVAGVAHEINSPSAAIRGSVDAMADNVRALMRADRALAEHEMPVEERRAFLALVEELAPILGERRLGSPAETRRRARELTDRFPPDIARTLVEIGADTAGILPRLEPFLLKAGQASILLGVLCEHAYLHLNATSIQAAIKQIQRIVGALKSYSHLDQAKVEASDLREGIENTLTLLHHELKYGIQIIRRYAQLPLIPVYVDELNQVWTNLIHNAVQALGGKGTITIETQAEDDHVIVRVIDDGPGIHADSLPRIFEPFFTTKAKGEGTGLGLGIVTRIVEKHHGTIEVTSRPGATCFTVRLPTATPAVSAAPVRV